MLSCLEDANYVFCRMLPPSYVATHCHTHFLSPPPIYYYLQPFQFVLFKFKDLVAKQHQQSPTHMWQSHVEMEGYSVAYFDRITVFEAPYL